MPSFKYLMIVVVTVTALASEATGSPMQASDRNLSFETAVEAPDTPRLYILGIVWCTYFRWLAPDFCSCLLTSCCGPFPTQCTFAPAFEARNRSAVSVVAT